MTTIRRILCPLDFSDTSDHALTAAHRLAQQSGAELHVMHAYQLPMFVDPDGAMLGGVDLRGHLTKDARAAVEERAERTGATAHAHLAEGRPHVEVKRIVEEIGADLVVLGTHGRTGLSRMLLGSVAERVVRTCPVPVITIAPTSERCPEPLAKVRSIACPVDFSPTSDRAVEQAIAYAEQLGAEKIELLHVFHLPVTFETDVGPLLDPTVLASLREQRERDLAERVEAHQGGAVAVTGRILEGMDHVALVDALDAGDYDLAIMGTHGRNFVAHLLLGSVAARVVRGAAIPVLTVRRPADAD